MTTKVLSSTLILGLLVPLALAPACAKTSADNVQPVEEPTRPTAVGEQPATDTRSYSVSGIYVDPELARTCGMSTPKAFFEFDSAAVEGADNSGLTALATCVSTGPLKDRKLELVGHADPRGTDEYNAKLGRSRAQSVQDFLAKEGVPLERMNTKSEGERGADETNADGWAYDRRVDVRLAP
jgi:peptidoglycan-associated lipoprotein